MLVGILVLYLAVDFIFGAGYRIPSLSDGPASMVPLKGASAVLEAPQLSHYLDPALSRNVFLPPPPPKPAAEGKAGANGQPAQAPQPPPTNLKLVGISWDETEYVAMIEYEGEKGARFVRKGDELNGGIKVEGIKEYSVSLSMGEQKWELN